MSVDQGLEFTIRKKVFTLFGAQFHIFNAEGELIGYCKQKAFKLKEDIRVYTDESASTELVRIAARSIIDFGAAYDVVQSSSGEPLGALRRKGLKSIFRDEWSVLGPQEIEIGKIQEDSTSMALIRRFVPMANLIPQKYSFTNQQGASLAELATHFNPFVHRMTVSCSPANTLNPMMMVAAGILLMAIEGRQNQ